MDVCDATLASLSLSLFYFLLALASLRSLSRRRHSSTSPPYSPSPSTFPFSPLSLSAFSSPSSSHYQRAFLACLLLFSLTRSLSLLLTPFLSSPPSSCSPPTLHPPSLPLPLSLLCRLPPSLFLLSASLLLFSLARIYHLLLLHSTRRHRRRLLLLLALTLTLTLISLTLDVAPLLVPSSSPALPYTPLITAVVCLTLSALLFAYGYLLHSHVATILSLSSSSTSSPSPSSPSPVVPPPSHSRKPSRPVLITHQQVAPYPFHLEGGADGGGGGSLDGDEREGGMSVSPSGYPPTVLRVGEEEGEGWKGKGEEELAGDGEEGDATVEYGDYPLPPFPSLPTPSSPAFTTPSPPPPSSPPPLSPSPTCAAPLVPCNPMRRLALLSSVCSYALALRAALVGVEAVWWGGVWGVWSGWLVLVAIEVGPVAVVVAMMNGWGTEKDAGGGEEKGGAEQRTQGEEDSGVEGEGGGVHYQRMAA